MLKHVQMHACVLVKPDAFVCTNKLKVQLTYIFPKTCTILFMKEALIEDYLIELSDANCQEM